jgi:hypothetical protein
MANDLALAESAEAEHGLELKIHITGPLGKGNIDEFTDIESGLDGRELHLPKGHLKRGRPDFPSIIRSICSDGINRGQITIAGVHFVSLSEMPR